MKKIHYAWIVCIACTLMLFCSIGLVSNIFSVYQPYIITLNQFTYTQGSTLITLRMIAAIFSLLLIDKYYQLLNLRLGAALAIFSIGIAYFLYAVADNYTGYAVAATVSGIGYSLGAMIPVSMIIGRWFQGHKAFALGICSAGTGAATVIMPTVITYFVETIGLQRTFFLEAVTIVVIAVVIYILVRNEPEDIGCSILTEDNGKGKKQKVLLYEPSSHDISVMLVLMFILGGAGSNGFTHLGVLYTSENYSSMQVASMISIAGIMLMVGKCIYGAVNDLIGTYKSNYIFVTFLILGLLGCCLCGYHNKILLFLGLLTLGLGFPINNIGVPLWAADMSNEQTYPKTLKHFQLAYTLGTTLFSLIPGISADVFGSYIPAYSIFTFCSVIFMYVLQRMYIKTKMQEFPANSSAARLE